MEFSPFHPLVQLCLKGMEKENAQQFEQASDYFQQAWEIASDDFEHYLVAYFKAKMVVDHKERLSWLQTCVSRAELVMDDRVICALPHLYESLSIEYEILGLLEKAKGYQLRANQVDINPVEKGPFYHGTRVELAIGTLLTAGKKSNYQNTIVMNHIYFTANFKGAALAASLAIGTGKEYIYQIEPTGLFEHDPNLTNAKFPGNPTRSYRSLYPLRIVGVVHDEPGFSSTDVASFKTTVEQNKGDIIN